MTPHQILGLEPNATDEEVRAAYRRLAMKHHPDKGGDIDYFTQIQKAYDKLKSRVCPNCNNLGFTTERHGIFMTKTRCHLCWNTKTE